MASSARASNWTEISTPSTFVVLRLTNNSNLVGCSTGRSAGLATFEDLVHVGAAQPEGVGNVPFDERLIAIITLQ
jgi:hypothetical protein